MKLNKKRLEFIEKVAIVGAIFLFLFIISYYTGFLRENCGQDKSCFNQKLLRCKSAELLTVKDNNIYTYRSYPAAGSDCKMVIRLDRVAVGADPDLKKLEGLNIKCKIPRENLQNGIDDVPSMMSYCSGKLKEELYGLLLKRMNENIVSQLSSALAEIKK